LLCNVLAQNDISNRQLGNAAYQLQEENMAAPKLSPALREEYAQLFQTCRINPGAVQEVTTWAQKMADNKERYSGIGDPLGVPWYIVAIVHYRECSLRFDRHLHNGDPLTARTVQVPENRPPTGSPPFSFEESATDALKYNGTSKWTDWALPGMLYKLESFNGFGYRMAHPHVLSPYLWGKSNHYVRGGYPKDHVWSDVYVNKQLGSAVLLRRLAELKFVSFDVDGSAVTNENPPSVWAKFENVSYKPNSVVALALELQQVLNKIPGIALKEDGKAGQNTSDAFKRVTGHYLKGDPRNS
jgi:lysozyme family protein